LIKSAGSSLHLLGSRYSQDIKHLLDAMQPVVPQRGLLSVPAPNSPQPVRIANDQNGHHSAYMQQWDGSKWVQVSDWIEPMKGKVMPLLEAAAADYVSKNQPWPKRTETCDKSP